MLLNLKVCLMAKCENLKDCRCSLSTISPDGALYFIINQMRDCPLPVDCPYSEAQKRLADKKEYRVDGRFVRELISKEQRIKQEARIEKAFRGIGL